MITTDDVVVVGGGLGGMATALALANTGVSVTLLERAPEFSEVGAGVQVGPNAVRALERLGLKEAIYDLAVFPENARISDAVTGEELTRLSLHGPMIERFDHPYLVMHRNDVLTALLDACRAHALVDLVNDRTVTSVVDDGPTATVVCEDGSRYRGRLVVGADGINSRVRARIRQDEPVFSGHVAYRGTVPVDQLSQAGRTDDVLLWIGPDIHLMQYPVRRGELYNQVAVFKSRWHAEGREEWGTPAELVERFTAVCPAVAAAIPVVAAARAYPNYDKPPLETYVLGRTVLVGDAAHPMLQNLGQGACQALEDALALAALLGGSVEDPSGALRAYDAARLPRTTRCQQVARPWGDSWHTDDPVTVAYRNRYLRARRSDDFSEVAWLYDDVLA